MYFCNSVLFKQKKFMLAFSIVALIMTTKQIVMIKSQAAVQLYQLCVKAIATEVR